MIKHYRRARIFIQALIATGIVVAAKYLLHLIGFEPIEQSSLHNSVISSVIFVIGFVLSATIADYKESEKIPALYASTIENMYEDAREIKKTYPKFDLVKFRKDLTDILETFRDGTRVKRHGARREISELDDTFTEMESAGVPANFIVKLKQQQGLLLNNMFRVNYIQRINVMPSAIVLVRSIVILVLGLLLLTNIDPFYSGLVITGLLAYVLVFMLLLIRIISVPFHPKGTTQDDVSLFLLDETKAHLADRANTEPK